MKIPNPNSDAPYDNVIKDHDGTLLYGERGIGNDKEIVNLKTGESNQNYYIPHIVFNPEGCSHTFNVNHMGKREVECSKCHLITTFIPGLTTTDIHGNCLIQFNSSKYPLTL